ncbi:cobalamin B12-binding domain-containing protein [Palleronia sp. LCG004]|uniref:cobalamin B12-binding domain-containing protein n=1 Tax=Palleronia sp. LCG004 TaxID=3079304 RepID=UPI0029438915|nr:cobalamin B12-binding domain-containing protein [Palleronia sp. LCG004]WOI56159.1 cobalamin B12-binding domain-containing protein [Palleronia sp. LCG004]
MPSPIVHPAQNGETGVTALARRALSVLAQRKLGGRAMSERFVERLRRATEATDPAQRDRLLLEMDEAGITEEEICDIYIPEVARRMGDDWVADRMSFAEVSIGTARLQSMLRHLLPPVAEPNGGAGNLIVLVLASEDHTLGAMVLTGQLRRIGVSVRLLLGQPLGTLAEIAASGDYDGILISVAPADDLSEVARTIVALRRASRARVPLIVGGGLLAHGAEAARARTGADYATNDLRLALQICGCEPVRPGPA